MAHIHYYIANLYKYIQSTLKKIATQNISYKLVNDLYLSIQAHPKTAYIFMLILWDALVPMIGIKGQYLMNIMCGNEYCNISSYSWETTTTDWMFVGENTIELLFLREDTRKWNLSFLFEFCSVWWLFLENVLLNKSPSSHLPPLLLPLSLPSPPSSANCNDEITRKHKKGDVSHRGEYITERICIHLA